MEDFWLKYMDKDKSITPRNKNGEAHGHWVVYDKETNAFWYECDFVNAREYGYEKWGNGETFYHAL